MALKQIRIGSLPDIGQYDDGDYTKSITVEDPIECTAIPVDPTDLLRLTDMPASVFAGVSGNVTLVTAIQAGGGGAVGFQYKDRTLTITDGIVTAIGAESGWNDV